MNGISWNPWHGCTKISPGCLHCYVYRQDAMHGIDRLSSEVVRNATFDLPVRRNRNRTYKVPPGSIVYTCFTSDFLVEGADAWRAEAWDIIRRRSDCRFFFFTKRIDRFAEVAPDDWGDGWDNVIIGCTTETQAMADYRLPIFRSLPLKHRAIIAAPLLERLDIAAYLDSSIEQVAVSGESGAEARALDYEWVLDLRRQCVETDVPFLFHQTGARLLKDGRLYRIGRRPQIAQASRAGIDYRCDRHGTPLAAAPLTTDGELFGQHR
ncbi:MAG: phage Gp37/Gp68 family protein [Alistipes sp.]|nr:phage Gp37/Gp68 family protein [Alistipes sp.]